MTANLRFCLSAFLASVMCFIAVPIHASPATWTFAPSKVGRALHEGGWTVEYALGQINASPEFCVLGIYPQITPSFTDDETEIPASSIWKSASPR